MRNEKYGRIGQLQNLSSMHFFIFFPNKKNRYDSNILIKRVIIWVAIALSAANILDQYRHQHVAPTQNYIMTVYAGTPVNLHNHKLYA